MRRRDLLVALLAAAGASRLRAAEANKVYRLAFGVFKKSFFSGLLIDRLQERGYVEGKNLIVDRYIIDDHADHADLVRTVARSKPDVIAFSLDHRLISELAKAAYPTPVVALLPSIAAGLINNMARPEGNITGVTLDAGIEMQGFE